jgi:hypothetical protein
VKSERPDLALTIARLVRSAAPVTPLDAPTARLARWLSMAMGVVFLCAVIVGARGDVAAQMANGWFVVRAATTLGIGVGAAWVVFLMSVPGVEPSGRLRALPMAGCGVWAVMLARATAATPAPLELLPHVTPEPSCVLLIAAIAMAPGAALVRMLRHAAPLQARWTAGLAGLASLALGALGAQVVCTNDAGAHHLLWHLAPVLLLTLGCVALGPALCGWPRSASATLQSRGAPTR